MKSLGHLQRHVLVILTGALLPTVVVGDPALKQLATFQGLISDVAWSPDGTRIAITVNLSSIWLVPADGGVPSLLVPYGSNPSWSPDGAQIVFDRADSLWSVPSQGGEAQPLTILDQKFGAIQPAWSPDGLNIAFIATGLTVPFSAVYKVPAAGGEATMLLLGNYENPSWSPDGNWIAVNGSSSLGKIPSAGGEVVQIPVTLGLALSPSWSPRGDWIACTYEFNGQEDIGLAPVTGGDVLKLTDDPALDEFPSWSPDGTRIVFSSNREGTWGLWVVDVPTEAEAATWGQIKARYR